MRELALREVKQLPKRLPAGRGCRDAGAAGTGHLTAECPGLPLKPDTRAAAPAPASEVAWDLGKAEQAGRSFGAADPCRGHLCGWGQKAGGSLKGQGLAAVPSRSHLLGPRPQFPCLFGSDRNDASQPRGRDYEIFPSRMEIFYFFFCHLGSGDALRPQPFLPDPDAGHLPRLASNSQASHCSSSSILLVMNATNFI